MGSLEIAVTGPPERKTERWPTCHLEPSHPVIPPAGHTQGTRPGRGLLTDLLLLTYCPFLSSSALLLADASLFTLMCDPLHVYLLQLPLFLPAGPTLFTQKYVQI